MTDRIELRVEGASFDGWKSVSVVRSIEQLANGFSLEKSERQPLDPERRALRRGQACDVYAGGERVVAGYIQKLAPRYDALSHSVAVSGWDATADLVKCSAVKAPKVPASLEQIVAALAAPFSISVTVDVDTGARFSRFKTQPGESAFSAIDRACRYRGVIAVSDGVGGLRITLPGSVPAQAVLEPGNHILAAEVTFDDADRFASITMQADQEAGWPGEQSPLSATAHDPAIDRYLPLVERADEPPDNLAALGALAQRAVNLRAAQAMRVAYTVRGWRHRVSSGPLWTPGELVTVRDPALGIQRDLLLSAATFTQDAQGQRSSLNLLRPEAFDLRKLVQPAPATPEFWGAP
jgi:prophage tail gpP-like protein